jgi:hypothetical protein
MTMVAPQGNDATSTAETAAAGRWRHRWQCWWRKQQRGLAAAVAAKKHGGGGGGYRSEKRRGQTPINKKQQWVRQKGQTWWRQEQS